MRKKILLLVSLVLTAILVLSGCGEKKPQKLANPCFEGAPNWVIDPTMEGGITGLGSAKIGPAGISFARQEATAAARDEMARNISVKVNNMFKSFTQTTGIGDAQTVDKVASNVSKQVASQLIEGSKVKNQWISPACNELFVLVVQDPNIAKQAVKQAVNTSLKNEQALWQLYQAKKATEEMDKEIEKEFGANK
ncbi:LPP20 family lipoprotein [Calditerrivibrio sp.]|jgi:hypothetical protein|uniref:LPP20 family lipoprotein n=1 Tax=Calditerrivibrio sp. TaxID=2792612 RepID=UPI003D116A0E